MIPTIFRKRKHAYARLFRHEAGDSVGDARIVLADLKRFARMPDAPVATGPTGIDPIATGIRIGRQEVVNRILSMTLIDETSFLNLREETDD